MSYVFNRITVKPQLPERIKRLDDISYNLWWSWNTEFLRLFKIIDIDLWEKCKKSPIKFLKQVSQDKIEACIKDEEFLRQYDKIVKDFDGYMNSKATWFNKKYPEKTQNEVIAYFSAEYGLDETVAIYSGGLGILSGDHMKGASDKGIPLVGIGLLYRNGYFEQQINGWGEQECIYKEVDTDLLPIKPVKDKEDNDLIVSVKMPLAELNLKVWQIDIGRRKLYLMDSDIESNIEEYKGITKTLYGGDQEMRIQQEIVLGMAGTKLVKALGLEPEVYHMNEGHSSFLLLELIKQTINEKQVSFNIARDIVTAKTAFTTHTPVPAGNDIFPIELVEKYFDGMWNELGITRNEFMELGMKPGDDFSSGFNMGILALKIAGRKNGVSKLHGAVSRELFGDVWPEVPANESPIGYVTNGVHICSWVAPAIKELYNEYLKPYWQDDISNDETWNDIYKIPNEKLWAVHQARKVKLLKIVKDSTTARLRRYNYGYDEIEKLTSGLDPNALTIGFARRFATYKRATLIFRDLERITQICNEKNQPVQFIFAGKAHPRDVEGQHLIRYIHELSLKPQFKGKIFILENYNIGMSRYLVAGVDVWLNNPRRPLEASGTSGQKAAANGVINFSVLDGWWAEGYNQKNGWKIGTNSEYQSYDEQDDVDAKSIYDTLQNKIIPIYYEKNEKGYSDKWLEIMKNNIATNAGRYSMSRMLDDYTKDIYVPLMNATKNSYNDLTNVATYNTWKTEIVKAFNNIKITQDESNSNDITVNAGKVINVKCNIEIPENITIESIDPQVYYGKITMSGVVDDIQVLPMRLEKEENGLYTFSSKINLKSGGDYGYTFRIVPKHPMLLNQMDLNLIKWITG